MKKETNISKKAVVQAVINQINEDVKPDRIETNYFPGYATPEKLEMKKTKKSFMPDIVAKYKNESNLYEVELEEKLEVDKWLLFSKTAQNRHGNFFIVVPDWLKEKVKEQLNDYQIPAKILYFTT